METLCEAEQNLAVVLLTRPVEIRELTALFEEVAAEQGWQPGEDISRHSSISIYFALKRGTLLLGGLQLVRMDNAARLPCQSIWPELDLSGRRDVAHVPILALKPQSRGKGNLFWLLCAEMWRYCMAEGISQVYLEVTPATLRLYRRIGWPLQLAGPLRQHWGEDCYLCSMRLGELADICISRAEKSPLYRGVVCQGLRLSNETN